MTNSQYSILLPADTIVGSPTPLTFDYYLASTLSYVQWVRDPSGNRIGESKPKPEPEPDAKPDDGPIEHSAIGLVAYPPTALTQKLVYDCRKIQRGLEIKRPQSLSPGNLVASGYRIEAGDKDPQNLAVIAGVIAANSTEYDTFDDLRTATYLQIIDKVYPEANFTIWRDLSNTENPIDVETLTSFAVTQVEAFLQGLPGSLLNA